MPDDSTATGPATSGSGSDRDQTRSLVSLLRALTVELDLFGAEFARTHGLHPTDVRALVALVEAERAEEPVTAGRLAQQLGLDSSSVTALVDRLVKLGHLRRERDPADRRRVLLVLEQQAHTMGWSFFGPLIHGARATMDDFDEAELSVVERFLRAMTDVVTETRSGRGRAAP